MNNNVLMHLFQEEVVEEESKEEESEEEDEIKGDGLLESEELPEDELLEEVCRKMVLNTKYKKNYKVVLLFMMTLTTLHIHTCIQH